jgi:peroxiredoxin
VFKAKRRTVVTVAAVATVLLAGALVVTLLTQGNGKASSSAAGTVEYPVGQRPLAPDFTANSLTGTPIKLASYRGKVVVVNFWGSWCTPCRDEAPTLAVLDQQYSKRGVVFLGDDVGDTSANALAFLKNDGIGYPSISDPGYSVEQRFGLVVPIGYTPTTVVIDPTGHISSMVVGKVTVGGMTTLLAHARVAT